jgi:hypothetical protein
MLIYVLTGAKRVEKMGVGSHVKNFEISELVRVITQATSNSEKIDNAKKIGEAIFQVDFYSFLLIEIYPKRIGNLTCKFFMFQIKGKWCQDCNHEAISSKNVMGYCW